MSEKQNAHDVSGLFPSVTIRRFQVARVVQRDFIGSDGLSWGLLRADCRQSHTISDATWLFSPIPSITAWYNRSSTDWMLEKQGGGKKRDTVIREILRSAEVSFQARSWSYGSSVSRVFFHNCYNRKPLTVGSVEKQDFILKR